MSVVHILKDGSIVKDITGHVVRVEDASALYEYMRSVNKKGYHKKSNKKSKGGLTNE